MFEANNKKKGEDFHHSPFFFRLVSGPTQVHSPAKWLKLQGNLGQIMPMSKIVTVA